MTALVFDFEDINRRMNRKPEIKGLTIVLPPGVVIIDQPKVVMWSKIGDYTSWAIDPLVGSLLINDGK